MLISGERMTRTVISDDGNRHLSVVSQSSIQRERRAVCLPWFVMRQQEQTYSPVLPVNENFADTASPGWHNSCKFIAG